MRIEHTKARNRDRNAIAMVNPVESSLPDRLRENVSSGLPGSTERIEDLRLYYAVEILFGIINEQSPFDDSLMFDYGDESVREPMSLRTFNLDIVEDETEE